MTFELKKGVSFEFIIDNCKTIGDLGKLHKEVVECLEKQQ